MGFILMLVFASVGFFIIKLFIGKKRHEGRARVQEDHKPSQFILYQLLKNISEPSRLQNPVTSFNKKCRLDTKFLAVDIEF